MKISVVMITYNHELYIREAINGILMQKVNFDLEIIISDDCSTDNTPAVIDDMIANHPKSSIIKYTRHQTNKGMMGNFIWTIQQCKGVYIGICEGDDYWTDPFKLQKQVDFLDQNPNFVMSYHSVAVLFPDGHIENDYLVSHIKKTESNIYDLVTLGNYIHTVSVVFRNVITEFPSQFYQSRIGDFFLWILLAKYGNVKKIDDVMAVYRIGIGIHSSQNAVKRNADFTNTLRLLLNVSADPTITTIIQYRLSQEKIGTLPNYLNHIDNLKSIGLAYHLVNYVSWKELLKALWKKLIRVF